VRKGNSKKKKQVEKQITQRRESQQNVALEEKSKSTSVIEKGSWVYKRGDVGGIVDSFLFSFFIVSSFDFVKKFKQ
jgi:hypothetical protein